VKIFNGKEHSKVLDEKIIKHLDTHKANTLGVIMIGDNPTSQKYVELKQKLGTKLGINVEVFKLDVHLSDNKLFETVKEIVNRKDIESVIIQLPLPRQSLQKLTDLIPTNKDVDTLSEAAFNKMISSGFSYGSPIIRACEYFLDTNSINLQGKNVLIIGKGKLVGYPLCLFAESLGANVVVVKGYNDYTANNKVDADLVICACGVPALVRGQDLQDGTCVIDFGSTVVDGRTTGDFDNASETSHLGVVSQSPGGMGPLVLRYLFMNHLKI